jgi:Na+/phosphate symporter
LFNLVNTIVFLILLTPLVALATRLVPDKRPAEVIVQPGDFLDTTATGTAALGLPAAAKETVTLGEGVRDFFNEGFTNALTSPITGAIPDEEIEAIKHRLRAQHRAIVGYLAELSHSARDDAQSHRLLSLVSEADELAHLADSLSSSFRRINRRRRRTGIELDQPTKQELLAEGNGVGAAFARAISGVDGREPEFVEEASVPSDRLVAARDMDRYVLESDLRDVLARVQLATDRIREARTAVGEDETLR